METRGDRDEECEKIAVQRTRVDQQWEQWADRPGKFDPYAKRNKWGKALNFEWAHGQLRDHGDYTGIEYLRRLRTLILRELRNVWSESHAELK